MKKILVVFALLAAWGAFADDTNIPWQFTGATNRVAAAQSEAAVTDFATSAAASFPVAYFDTLRPGELRLDQCNLDTTPGGLLLLFR